MYWRDHAGKIKLIKYGVIINLVFIKRYIMDANSGFVTIFHILISIIVVPNVLLYLHVIAFGDKEEQQMTKILQYSEFFFLLEIIQNFFTSYSDPEHYDTIDSIKLIATRYVLNGSFIVHALAVFPWYLVLAIESPDDQ